MIYLLAPFSFDLNTTSRNRILSFHSQLQNAGYECRVLSPSPAKGNSSLYLHGTHSAGQLSVAGLVFLRPSAGWSQNIKEKASSSKRHAFLWKIVNLLHLFREGTDLHYPVDSLQAYFAGHPPAEDDLIIASGPPFSLVKAAADFQIRYGCKLIVDYRDPWTYGYRTIDTNPYISRLKKLMGRRVERYCLGQALAALCDTESVKRLYPRNVQSKVSVIQNGANLDSIDVEKIRAKGPTFRIVYLGTMYYDQLKDESFFDCLQTFLSRKGIHADFELIFVGAARNRKLPALVKKYQLDAFVEITERLDIKAAMEIAYTASAFLHLKYADCEAVDTSKQLDYLALQKPILLPLSDNGNVARSIREHQAGYVCHNFEECYAALEELWEKHVRGESFRIPRSEEFLYSISREHEAEKLVRLVADALQTDPSSKKEDICTSL